MADDIEIQFNSQRGHLYIWCKDEAFARICNAVISETGVVDALNGNINCVQSIEITVMPVTPFRPRLRDRMALLGCGLAAFVILFVLIIGVFTIAGWLR